MALIDRLDLPEWPDPVVGSFVMMRTSRDYRIIGTVEAKVFTEEGKWSSDSVRVKAIASTTESTEHLLPKIENQTLWAFVQKDPDGKFYLYVDEVRV